MEASPSSNSSVKAVVSVLNSWQDLVNLMLVPLYSGCILLYLLRMFVDEFWIKFVHASSEKQKKKKAPPPPPPQVNDDGHVNMSGSYKLISNENFDGFLAVQGVPSFLRRAANQARPLHIITHSGKSVTIQIKGIIESQTTYLVDGPPVETKVRGRVFSDQMTYLEDGIIVTKKALQEAYDVTVARQLSKDRQQITLTSRATFKDHREPVTSIQIFKRIQE